MTFEVDAEQTVEHHHGQLDDDAAARMDDILAQHVDAGIATDAGTVMSMAVRMYHAALLGEVRMVPAETLLEACNREIARRESGPH